MKFRIWNKKAKEFENTTPNIKEFKRIFTIQTKKEQVIQQGTGILDVNKKEIYEGDIVKIRAVNWGGFCEVVYCCEWFLKDVNGGEFMDNLINIKNVKIVGNIFEMDL